MEKSYEAQKRSRLLTILYLLVGLHLIVVVGRNTSMANVESSQLNKNQ
jgi:hypothetical protein